MEASESVTPRLSLPAMAAGTAPQHLPALIGELAAAQAVCLLRIVESASASASAQAPRPLDRRLLTMPEAAERLGLKEHQVREMGRRGLLPVVRVSARRVRVDPAALEDYMRSRTKGGRLSAVRH